MRIVDLTKLSEKEKKKVLQEQQTMIKQRQEENNQIQAQANQMFNSLASNNNNNIKNNGYVPIWQQVQNMVNTMQNTTEQQRNTITNTNNTIRNKISSGLPDLGRTIENTWIGAKHGTQDAVNYLDTMINGYKSKEDKQLINSIFTNKLSNEEKNAYIATKLSSSKYAEDYIRNKINEAFPGLDKNMVDLIVKQQMEREDIKNKIGNDELNKYNNLYKANQNKIDAIVNKDIQKRQEEKQKISENIQKQSNILTQKLAEVAPSVGQMAVGMGVSAVNPIAGATYFTASAGGGYLEDAEERGMNPAEAKKYATAMGIMEGLTEQITVGNLKKAGIAMKSVIKGTGKEVAKSGAQEVAKASIKEALKSYGLGITENAVQEAIMEPIQETMAGMIGNKANWDNMGQRMLESGINGGIVGIIAGGGEIGIQSCVAVQEKINNGETPTIQEVRQALQDASKQVDVEKIMTDNIQATIQNNQLNEQQQIVPLTQENISNQNMVESKQSDLKGKSFEDIVDEAMANYEENEIPSPLKNRDIKTIGKETKVNAYQYDNPEVKPFFQEMAQMIGEDVGNIASQENRKTNKGGGTSLNTNISSIEKLHNEMGYSYNQIIDGIVNIIDDHGKENNALSKKLEILIDDQLRNGYVNSYGKYISPNEKYINLINNSNQNTTDKTNIKEKQLEIINKNNPMQDDYHTGIRNVEDIKTFDEAINDDESFVYGDFSKEDAEKALKKGKVTVYSSKPIEQGSFVSTSQNMAKDYAENGKVYSQEVNLDDVAWINGDEGQYAKVGTNIKNNSNTLENRVSGDDLLNAQDLIEELKSVGADIDENGYVTLYHQTTKENADNIIKNGKMSAKEDGIFFSTSKDASQADGRGNTKLEFKIPAEILVLDDIFDNNADVKIPLENKNKVLNVSDYLSNIANNQETLYNNSNESESDINENSRRNQQDDRGRVQELFELYQRGQSNENGDNARVQENKGQQITQDTIKKELINYAEKNQKNNLTQEEQEIKDLFKNLGGEAILYEFGDNNFFSGLSNTNKVYIDTQSGENIKNIAFHELVHFLRQNKNEVYSNEIESIINKIASDFDYQEAIFNYAKSSQGFEIGNLDFSKQYQLAEEIIADTTASIYGDLEADYGLSQKDINSIKSAIDRVLFNNKDNVPTQGEKINWNKIERPDGKFRKHYQSIIESSNTTAEAKAIAKEMMGTDTYVPESNQSLIQKADARIGNTNPDTELNSLYSRVMNNEKVTDVDIAVGERLIEYYSKIGDKEHLADAIHATAMAGTQAGRTVQAFALLNHMTPQGQVVWLQRSIDKVNNELQEKYRNKKNIPQFKLTQEMADKILNTNSEKEMFETLDDVYKELGQQVPKSMSEKIDEWRYFSMLANLKTHGRNIIGNVAMHFTQRAKDKIAGVIEGTVAKFNPEMERTHTIVPTSKEVKEFAKNDFKNLDVQTQLEINENKYNPQSRLQNAKKTFKSDMLNKTLGELFNINSKLLEVEDNIGLKSMYVKALGEYITANKLDINNMTDAQLAKARQHAIKEAKEATFHQASSLATALNQMGRKNNITKFALDAVVPFKKTPINVAKAGAQYSPVGLIKTAVYDTAQLRKGNITINEYINNISKGLTGTGIAYLGYALAEAGILKASGGDDDKKEKYDEEQGKQSYALEIGGKTYSLDWLSPVGIPLFIGAETNQQFNQTKKEKISKSSDDNETLNNILKSVTNIANGVSNAMNPMSEMSMISGLTNVLSSYNKENAVGDMIVNSGKSYINQFVPTVLGQLARTTDDYERTTKSTKTGTLEKAIDSTINQVKSKIPGLRESLPIKTDIWGKEVKQDKNLPFRAFNNFINPSKVQDVSNDKVDKELNALYSRTKESSIIPKNIEKTLSINGTDYRLTNEEYAKYSKKFGKEAYNLLDRLISSKEYKNLTDEQKQKAIENTYSYAKESNKNDYANKIGETIKPSTLYNTMEALGTKERQSQYLSYLSKASDVDKDTEKNAILLSSDIDKKTKKIIYSKTTGKDDKMYDLLKDIDINEYLDYKIKNNNGKFKADKTKDGKTISGSSKKKIYNYANENISGYENRLLFLGYQYKLTRKEQQALAEHINSISQNDQEAKEMFKKFSKNFQEKNGKIYFK